jgi:hypothetical protein
VQRRIDTAQEVGESRASLAERPLAKVVRSERQQVESDVAAGRLEPQPLHARGGWMQASEQRREVEAAACRHHDLAVEHRVGRRQVEQGLDQLREVARERPVVATAQIHTARRPERQAAKAIPLRLVREAVDRQLAGEPSEHRRHGRLNDHRTRAGRSAQAREKGVVSAERR